MKKREPYECSAGSPMQQDKQTNRETHRKISKRRSDRQMDDVVHASGHMQKKWHVIRVKKVSGARPCLSIKVYGARKGADGGDEAWRSFSVFNESTPFLFGTVRMQMMRK